MKAILGTESWAKMQTRARQVAAAVDAGVTVAEADYHLNFADAAQLWDTITPARLALLERLAALRDRSEHGPGDAAGEASIERLADALQRDRASLSADVAALHDLSLIERDADGRLRMSWESIEIHLTLGQAKAA